MLILPFSLLLVRFRFVFDWYVVVCGCLDCIILSLILKKFLNSTAATADVVVLGILLTPYNICSLSCGECWINVVTT